MRRGRGARSQLATRYADAQQGRFARGPGGNLALFELLTRRTCLHTSHLQNRCHHLASSSPARPRLAAWRWRGRSWKRLLAGGSGVVRLGCRAAGRHWRRGAARRGRGRVRRGPLRAGKPGDEGSLSPFIRFALAAADEALAAAGGGPRARRSGSAPASRWAWIGGLDDIVQAGLRERARAASRRALCPRCSSTWRRARCRSAPGCRAVPAPTACATGRTRSATRSTSCAPARPTMQPRAARHRRLQPAPRARRRRRLWRRAGGGVAALRPAARRLRDGRGRRDARARDARPRARAAAEPLAEVRGVGLSLDAHHPTGPSENGEGALRAMRAALDAGGVGVDELDYVNAHATSTPAGDAAEAAAIAELVRGRAASSTPLLVSAPRARRATSSAPPAPPGGLHRPRAARASRRRLQPRRPRPARRRPRARARRRRAAAPRSLTRSASAG